MRRSFIRKMTAVLTAAALAASVPVYADTFSSGTGHPANAVTELGKTESVAEPVLSSPEPAVSSSEPEAAISEVYDTGSFNGRVYMISTVLNGTSKVNVYNTYDFNGTNIHLWEANQTQAQKFLFVYDGDGYYHILNVHSWKAVDVEGGNAKPGANVQQWTYNGSAAQKWRVVENSDGTVTFKSKLGTVLDVAGGSADNLTNIQTYTYNGTAAQKWKMTQVRLSLEDASVSLSISQKAYTGSAVTPGVKVKFNSRVLAEGDDYSVAYADNVEPGTASVTVTGSGLYFGTKTANFDIIETEDGIDAGGTYVIVSKADPNLAIDVTGGGIVKGTRVWLHGKNQTEAQMFTLTKNSDGSYQFVNEKSELSLDVSGNSQANGAAVQVYEPNYTNAQKWKFFRNTDGTYTIANSSSGKVLDVPGGRSVQDAYLQMYEPNGTDAQKFVLIETDAEKHEYDGTYVISSADNTEYSLDVAGGSRLNGANVQTWQVNSSDAQKFDAIYSGDGYYRLINSNSGKALDIAGGSPASGANIGQYEWNGTAAQLWKITKNEDGTYMLESRLGSVADIAGNAGRGANVQANAPDGSSTQKWYLVPTGRDVCLSSAPGQRTVLSLLQNAMKPVGRTLYILDGGWNYGNIPADPVDARIIGYQDAWWNFFKQNARLGYDFNQFTFQHGNGLDCSGYVHWAVYNTLFSTNGENYELQRSFDVANEYQNYGWATTSDPTLHPGDIMSVDEGNSAGHVYIVLGVCSDGSVLLAHSTLVPYGTQGAGVQISGTSAPGTETDAQTMDSVAAKLAAYYMAKYFPEWPFAPVEEPYSAYVSGNVVKATWITNGASAMSDAAGVQNMSGEAVMKLLLGQ
jgi:cell wall-associated NlpC family hydrolase